MSCLRHYIAFMMICRKNDYAFSDPNSTGTDTTGNVFSIANSEKLSQLSTLGKDLFGQMRMGLHLIRGHMDITSCLRHYIAFRMICRTIDQTFSEHSEDGSNRRTIATNKYALKQNSEKQRRKKDSNGLIRSKKKLRKNRTSMTVVEEYSSRKTPTIINYNG